MIKVDGGKVILDGSDGLLLKELSYLVAMLEIRMVAQGQYLPSQVRDASENAVLNAKQYSLEDLRSDARMALERATKEEKIMYYGIGSEQGKMIEEDEAFDYALERCLKGTLEDQKEFKEMLVEWFYSGNWIKA